MSATEALRAALAELVALKALKERLDRPSIFDLDSGKLPELRREYERRKPIAWERARAVLASAQEPAPNLEALAEAAKSIADEYANWRTGARDRLHAAIDELKNAVRSKQ